jgi:hypothetical protein
MNVRAVVTRPDGSPIIGAKVEFLSTVTKKLLDTVKTTDKGGAVIGNPAGAFFVRARVTGERHRVLVTNFGNSPCYDYVIDADGNGTHTTVRLAMAAILAEMEAAPGVTRSMWLCGDDQDLNIEFGSTDINVKSGTLSIEGAGAVHESNATAATPRHTLTAGPAASMVNGSAYFKTTNPYRPRLVYRNVRLVAKYTSDANTISFMNASGGAGAFRMMAGLYGCDLDIGFTTSANGVICDGDTNGAGNGAELYLHNCRGSIGGLIRFHINNAAGSVEVDDCRITMFSFGSNPTNSTIGSITFRGGYITTTGHLISDGEGGLKLTLQGTTFRHTGAEVWLTFAAGDINPNIGIYIEGLAYSQSSTTLGAVIINGDANGNGHTLFIDSCSFRSDSANAATAVVVTGTNWLSTQIGNVSAPNFAAASSGIGAALPSLVIGGTGSTIPTAGAGLEIISPVGAGAGLTVLMPRFPTTARPASPTSGMFYYDSTLGRFVGYENSVWATIVTNEGEGLKYPLLNGRGTPTGNAFIGYGAWGTAVGSSPYAAAVQAIAGLQAYWRNGEASGNLADTTVNANTMTAVGTPTYSVAGALPSESNNAISLPQAAGSYFTCPSSASTNVGDTFSIVAWIKISSIGIIQEILGRTTNGYGFRIDATGRLLLVKCGNSTDTTSVISTTTMAAGSYHMVVVTKATSTNKLYIDNIDVTGSVTNQTLSATGLATRMGMNARAVTFPFGGSIDEVALWNVALTPANIAALWTAATSTTFAPAPVNTGDGDITGVRLFLANATNTFQTGFQSGPIAASITYQWPTTAPTAGQGLQSTAPVAGVATLSWAAVAAVSNALLDGVAHSDTLAGSVLRGDIIVGNATPAWARVAKGAAGSVLFGNGTDSAWTINPLIAGYVRIGSASAPTNVTAGDLTCVRLFVNNSTFSLVDSGADVAIVFDTNDYLSYIRASNTYRLFIGGGNTVLEISEVVAGERVRVTAGTPGSKAGLFRIPATATYQGSLEIDGQTGSGDTDWTIDTYGNQLRFMSVAGTEYYHFAPTGLRVLGYARIGSLSVPTNTAAGDLTVDGILRVEGNIDHNGSNVGFFGTAPAARASAYTPTNVTTDRAYDADATTLDEIADVLGTLIADLKTYGLLQ